MIKARALRKGDCIGVAAPAAAFREKDFRRGVDAVETLGFRVRHLPDIFARRRYMAGDDARRAGELAAHMDDPVVKAVFTVRGGFGTQRIVGRLDGAQWCTRPKIVLGMSDVTFLMLWMTGGPGIVPFHGPFLTEMAALDPVSAEAMLKTLTSTKPLGLLPSDGMEALRGGVAGGPLVGGNLTMICHSLGTPWEIETEGRVLFLEDRGERPYRIERLLVHLRMAGKLDRAAAVVFGHLTSCAEPGMTDDETEALLKEIILDVLEPFPGPILYRFPAGHGRPNITMPLGVQAVADGDACSLSIEESALTA